MKRGSEKIIFGGWYQRTTLHLTEVYEFLKRGKSRLKLSKTKLLLLQKNLNLDLGSIQRIPGKLEHIKAKTNSGIEIRYYEDGLYVLELESNNIETSSKKMRDYFEKRFKPALSYIFSLGAPTPKVLANIKDDHPIVIAKSDSSPKNFKPNKKYGEVYSKNTTSKISVYKTPGHIFLITRYPKESLNKVIETQIFFREFKDQLHKYLNIHRKIWEEIDEIKQIKEMKGEEVSFYREKLDQYQKTISLISDRISQMKTYAHTRSTIAKSYKIEDELKELFQYRFEDLFNTLAYIKEIWNMTKDYVNSAIQILVEIDEKISQTGVKSVRILASIGVVTGVLGYLARDALPKLSSTGALYLIGLGVVAFILDFIMKKLAENKKYILKFKKRYKDI